jgi:hypothetical protein
MNAMKLARLAGIKYRMLAGLSGAGRKLRSEESDGSLMRPTSGDKCPS